MPIQAFVATKNAGKLAELRAIFAGSPLELHAFEGYADVEETGDSYVVNALLKARALADQLHDAGIVASVLADDSGLEVDALQGGPGLYSARYAGVHVSWTQRRVLLLRELAAAPANGRSARFVAALALVRPDGESITAVGTVNGNITTEERGDGGFGYDPVFYYPPRGCTFAELTADEKNAVSHRRAAATALLEALDRR